MLSLFKLLTFPSILVALKFIEEESSMSIDHKELKYIYWVCDKRHCQKENHRKLYRDEIIIDDNCDYCSGYIKEPIMTELNLLGPPSGSFLKKI